MGCGDDSGGPGASEGQGGANSYFTVRSGDDDDDDPVLSKHIWIGSRRVLSKLVPTGDLDDLPPDGDSGGGGLDDDDDDDDDPPPPSASELPRKLPEDFFIFYYHPDHLGALEALGYRPRAPDVSARRSTGSGRRDFLARVVARRRRFRASSSPAAVRGAATFSIRLTV